jgi:hypothetical protein
MLFWSLLTGAVRVTRWQLEFAHGPSPQALRAGLCLKVRLELLKAYLPLFSVPRVGSRANWRSENHGVCGLPARRPGAKQGPSLGGRQIPQAPTSVAAETETDRQMCIHTM